MGKDVRSDRPPTAPAPVLVASRHPPRIYPTTKAGKSQTSAAPCGRLRANKVSLRRSGVLCGEWHHTVRNALQSREITPGQNSATTVNPTADPSQLHHRLPHSNLPTFSTFRRFDNNAGPGQQPTISQSPTKRTKGNASAIPPDTVLRHESAAQQPGPFVFSSPRSPHQHLYPWAMPAAS